ncbi:hypothetical protein DFJ73DRAFT_832815 [Zopfochytrium polystomum]|nr:hypothetical protein DFJ73DRAFT_832815 [Zopfochytrium polystomum]
MRTFFAASSLALLAAAIPAMAQTQTSYNLVSQSHCSNTMSQIQWDIVPVPKDEIGLPLLTFMFTPTTAGATIGTPTSFQPSQGTVNGNTFTIQTINDGPKLGFVLSGIGCDAAAGTFNGFALAITGTVKDINTGNTVPVTITGDAFVGTAAGAGGAAGGGGAATTTTAAPAPTGNGGGNGGVVTVTVTSTVLVTVTAGQPTPTPTPTTAANGGGAAANGGGAAAATGLGVYTLTTKIGNCWGNPATAIVSTTISINGHQPMGDADGGLANIQMTFGGAGAVTAPQTWNVANSQTSGSTWSFDVQDDQPNVGGSFQFAGATCTNGALSPVPVVSATGTFLTGGSPVTIILQ